MERVSVTESPYGERERLNDALIRFNLLRTRQPQDPLVTDLLEGAVDALFSASHYLIAYGSLMPGGLNHGLLAGLRGEWRQGWVAGELLDRGWSAAMSYPALRWCPEGGEVPAWVFISEDLPEHWRRLDDFEGLEYRRIWALFWDAEGQTLVGNVYAMECDLGEDGGRS
jgi:gamma-glutamylcyclotransferase (GGCT)/AIG2-like uncharacterized protein YtfP